MSEGKIRILDEYPKAVPSTRIGGVKGVLTEFEVLSALRELGGGNSVQVAVAVSSVTAFCVSEVEAVLQRVAKWDGEKYAEKEINIKTT